ncbi:MAG: zf-TFIIB domain-containing protein [bacterium]|nr:zf-TFIIB domain-containing protein [bacterium]
MKNSHTTFKCPKCKTDTLSNFNTSEGVIVDFCDSCFGIWFDKDELGQYIELSKDIPELEAMKKKARKTDLVCPKCQTLLEELPFSSKTEILIERCPGCEGTFFDAGEVRTAESASADLEDVKQRMSMVFKQLKEQGYSIIPKG